MLVKTNAINYLDIKIQNRNYFFFLNSLTNMFIRIIFIEFALFSTMSLKHVHSP